MRFLRLHAKIYPLPYYDTVSSGRGAGGIEMKSLDIPIVITPTLTLPRQRGGRGIPGFPDEN
jgi:hypothetical protein